MVIDQQSLHASVSHRRALKTDIKNHIVIAHTRSGLKRNKWNFYAPFHTWANRSQFCFLRQHVITCYSSLTSAWWVGNSLPSHSKHLTSALGEEDLVISPYCIEPSWSLETQVEITKPHLNMMKMKCRHLLLLGFVVCTRAIGNAVWTTWMV